jgi:hypothetical protein
MGIKNNALLEGITVVSLKITLICDVTLCHWPVVTDVSKNRTDPEDDSNIILRNIGKKPHSYTCSWPGN